MTKKAVYPATLVGCEMQLDDGFPESIQMSVQRVNVESSVSCGMYDFVS